MVQIDPLLAYGFASTLAVAADKRADERAAQEQPPLVWTLLWLALAFAPQAVFLLWRYPAWETMFVFASKEQIPPWVAAGTPMAIVLFGYAGFVATTRLRRSGRPQLAALLAAASLLLSLLIVTVGWDGGGWRRMLYAGSGADWSRGTHFTLVDFLRSDLLQNLVWLEALLLIPFAVMLLRWWRPRLRVLRSAPHSEVRS